MKKYSAILVGTCLFVVMYLVKPDWIDLIAIIPGSIYLFVHARKKVRLIIILVILIMLLIAVLMIFFGFLQFLS